MDWSVFIKQRSSDEETFCLYKWTKTIRLRPPTEMKTHVDFFVLFALCCALTFLHHQPLLLVVEGERRDEGGLNQSPTTKKEGQN